jgi:hypothetical protein
MGGGERGSCRLLQISKNSTAETLGDRPIFGEARRAVSGSPVPAWAI